MTKRLRGAFINTEPALCSIHESGRQVFDCIVGGSEYDLDYIDFQEIDQTRLMSEGALHLISGVARSNPIHQSYDFWVLNYHNSTMAPFFSRELVTRLAGPKFAIVLEVEPAAPLAFAERGVFDGYIVLDPSATPTHEVFPFPRPLNSLVKRPITRRRAVPVIGSFGMGTPGKGFEQVVEAVNREFDRAIVRINVPASTYADGPMFGVHGESYAGHLKRLCEYIAKPGIEVRFTNDFMDDDQLLKWCGENDLNLFLYSRRQSGLSATTDQAIASGRPVLVSSNDTFRHIHPYIPPYPLTSLKEAMTTGASVVAKIQKDWSRQAFSNRFVGMLEAAGVLPQRGGSLSRGAPSGSFPERGLVLVTRGESTPSGETFSYPNRVADVLRRTGERLVVDAPSTDAADLAAAVMWHQPDIILAMDDDCGDLQATLGVSGFDGQFKSIGLAEPDGREGTPTSASQTSLSRRPLIPYATVLAHLPEGPPQICLIGFASPDSELEIVISKVQRELGGGIINVIAGNHDWAALRARLTDFEHQLMFTPSVELRILDLDRSAPPLTAFFSRQRVVICGYDSRSPEDILSLCEIALTTERAVVFAGAPIPHFEGREPRLADFWMPDLFLYGSAVQVGLVADYGEGAYLAYAAEQFATSSLSHGGMPWRHHGLAPAPNAVVSAQAAAWYADDEHTGRFSKPLQPQYLKTLLGFARSASQRFGQEGGDILVYGPIDRLPAGAGPPGGQTLIAAEGLNDAGRPVSFAVGTRMLSDVEDSGALLAKVVDRLTPGGIGAFAFFFRDGYAEADERDNIDFPAMTRADLDHLIQSLPIELVDAARWEADVPIFAPDPFGPLPLATLLFRKTPNSAAGAS